MMNGRQGCNLSLSMSRRPMTSSAVLTCAALHVCLPRKKNTGCWVMDREVKAKRGKNSIEQMAGGVKDGVETYMKRKKKSKKTIPRPPVCLWDFKMCTHAADIISVRPHRQAGPTRRAPRSLSHIIIWHRTPIICCA